MKIDLHIHSKYSFDSDMDIESIIHSCKEKGLEGVCLTEHHSFLSSEPAEKFANQGIKIFRGAEASTNLGHLLIFGIQNDEWNTWDGVEGHFIDAQTLISYVNDLDGACVLAHPFRKEYLHPVEKLVKLKGLAAVEVYNGKHVMALLKGDDLRAVLGLKSTGGSDAHAPDQIGESYTIFEKRINDIKDLIYELKHGEHYGKLG